MDGGGKSGGKMGENEYGMMRRKIGPGRDIRFQKQGSRKKYSAKQE